MSCDGLQGLIQPYCTRLAFISLYPSSDTSPSGSCELLASRHPWGKIAQVDSGIEEH